MARLLACILILTPSFSCFMLSKSAIMGNTIGWQESRMQQLMYKKKSFVTGVEDEIRRLVWLLGKIQVQDQTKKRRLCLGADCWGILTDDYSYHKSVYISDLLHLEEWARKNGSLDPVESDQSLAFTAESAARLEDYLYHSLDMRDTLAAKDESLLVFEMDNGKLRCGLVIKSKLKGRTEEFHEFARQHSRTANRKR